MDNEGGSRLAAILKNVITTEINLRAADLTTAEQNINTVREYLNRARQGVCADFYDDNFKTTLQKPAHRAVKKTFAGKTPIKQEPVYADDFTQSSSSRWSYDSQLDQSENVEYKNCETIKEEPPDLGDIEGLKQEKVDADEDPQPKYLDPDDKVSLISDVEKRRPRYIPPVIPVSQIQHSLKPRGNQTMKKVRFLVRNNSKYILTPEDSSGATHKWSLTVKLNDESMDISQIVSKVVFYLHPSYKPHDVVTVYSAPFKITRRGWGEFDLRVKIFFLNEKNEAVAVIHPLVFDKLHSGMETFGGETIFDHWINDPSDSTIMNSVDGTLSSKGDELNLSNRTEQLITYEATCLPMLPSTTFDDLSTMPFNNETSKHFLSAIFGEPEELSAAKKDWEQFDNLFNLDDLAFPEFFGFGMNDPKLSTTGKSGDGSSQLGLQKVNALPGNVTDTVLDQSAGANQSISAITSKLLDSPFISSGSNRGPVQVNSLATDLEGTVESTRDIDENLTYEYENPNAGVSSKVKTSADESSLQNRDSNVSSGLFENVEQELYLSDLAEFGDEVIIMDSNEGSMDQNDVQPAAGMKETVSAPEKNLPECVGVDYSSMEMDDLIKFPSDKPSSSGVGSQERTKPATNSCRSSSVYMAATSKKPAAPPKKDRQISENVKATPQSALKTGVTLVTKPRATLLVTSANLSSIMANKIVTNSPPTTLLVSSSNMSSIMAQTCVTNIPPTTLIVSSSSLPSIVSSKCLSTSTVHQKISAKNSNRTIIRKVAAPRNTNTVPSISNIAKGGSPVTVPSISRASLQGSLGVPLRSSVTSAIAAGGQPITLLSVINTSSASTPVSKTAPIVIGSPKVVSQATPTLLVPSSMILKPALSKTVTNAVIGQLNSTVLSQAIPLAPKTKGSKMITNVMKMSPTQVSVRPGSTRFLVKMPDGTLKPINLESLTPLKPSELKIANPVASGSRSQVLVPQPVLLRPPVAASVVPAAPQPPALSGVAPRGKRSFPTHTILPAKRRKTEPKAGTFRGNVRAQRTPIILSASPRTVFKLPRSPNQLLVVPQAANHPVIRLQSPQRKPNSTAIPILNESPVTAAVPTNQLRKPAADPELPSNLIPKPEGMSILKRRPPETEVDARSLIDQCPRYSTEVSICWLLKKFPLVYSGAGEESYKQAFPYCAVNTTQFNQWPLAKRRAHELLRANDVFRVAKQIYPDFDWKKLDIIQFARLRGFTPLVGKINPSVHIHKLPAIKDLPSLADTEKISMMLAAHQEDTEDIDVTCIEEDKPQCNVQPSIQSKERKGKIFMTLQGQLEDAMVVEQWVERVSIFPEPEEIEPGVMFPAALRVLVSAFHSFAEDLIRRSYSSSYLRHNSMEPHNVAPGDVQLALYSRKEFDLFTKQGFGTRNTKASKTPLEIKEPPKNK